MTGDETFKCTFQAGDDGFAFALGQWLLNACQLLGGEIVQPDMHTLSTQSARDELETLLLGNESDGPATARGFQQGLFAN